MFTGNIPRTRKLLARENDESENNGLYSESLLENLPVIDCNLNIDTVDYTATNFDFWENKNSLNGQKLLEFFGTMENVDIIQEVIEPSETQYGELNLIPEDIESQTFGDRTFGGHMKNKSSFTFSVKSPSNDPNPVENLSASREVRLRTMESINCKKFAQKSDFDDLDKNFLVLGNNQKSEGSKDLTSNQNLEEILEEIYVNRTTQKPGIVLEKKDFNLDLGVLEEPEKIVHIALDGNRKGKIFCYKNEKKTSQYVFLLLKNEIGRFGNSFNNLILSRKPARRLFTIRS
jgi:hypothetical protein